LLQQGKEKRSGNILIGKGGKGKGEGEVDLFLLLSSRPVRREMKQRRKEGRGLATLYSL